MLEKEFKDFEQLSLRGRLAVAISCLERYFISIGIDHPEIGLYFQWLWDFLTLPASNMAFQAWIDRQPCLIETSQGWEFPECIESYLIKHDYSKDEFRWLIEIAADVVYRSLWSTPQRTTSMKFLIEILYFVVEKKLSLPSAEIFNNTKWDDFDGWGRRLSDEEARTWRQRATSWS